MTRQPVPSTEVPATPVAGGCPFQGSLVERATADPHAAFADLRQAAGDVAYDAETDTWYVLTERLARPLLRDERLRARGVPVGISQVSEADQRIVRPVEEFLARWLVFSDPPTQRLIRRALAPTLTRTATAELTAGVADAAAGRLAAATGGGDFVGDIALPLTRVVTARLLEADDAQMDRLESASDAFIDYLGTDGFSVPKAEIATAELEQLTALVVEELLPAGGRIPDALAGPLADGRIEQADAVAVYAQFLTGAMDPLTTSLSSAVARLAGEGPERVPQSAAAWAEYVESTLRASPAFHFAPRNSTVDIELGSSTIPAGSRVVLNLLAANDAAEVTDDQHLTFGAGTHYCLGAALSRSVLVRLLPMIEASGLVWRIDPDDIERRPSFGMTGYTRIGFRAAADRVPVR